MGILRREYEREARKQQRPEIGGGAPRGGGSFPPILGIGLVLLLIILLTNWSGWMGPAQSFAPSDLSGRATQLAGQQQELSNSMTHAASASTEQAYAAQQEVQRQQNDLNTQVAAATATESIYATATSFALTQTPLAATQTVRDLDLQKQINDAYWNNILAPVRIIFFTLIGFVVLAGAIALAGWAIVKFIRVKADVMRFVKEERGERTLHVGESGAITNTALMHAPVLTPNKDGTMAPSGGAPDPAMQERVAANAAKVKAIQAYPPNVKVIKGMMPPVPDAEATTTSTPSLPATNNAFPLPNWQVFESWDGKNGLPYGLSSSGLETMRLESHPHIGVLGKTGSGKSRRFLRPFLAGALAAGQRVVIVGKSVDFVPFQNHPNATLVAIRELTMEGEAQRYAQFLRMMVEEMNRRDEYLTSHHHSTWAIAGRENTLIVLDEVGNALDLMPRAYAELSYRYMRGLTKEGRKVGFNIVFASQRAKGFRDVITQVGRVVFFVEDEQESRFALGATGAEQLTEGYFYSKFGALKLTGSFDPTDVEIRDFLARRPVKPLERQDWIDADAKDIQRFEDPGQTAIVGTEQKIRMALGRMKEEGKVSLSAVQREVYGEDDSRGGVHFKTIQEIWTAMQAESATATDTKGDLGTFPSSATNIATGSA